MADYRLVAAYKQVELESRVYHWLLEGYKPLGNVTVITIPNKETERGYSEKYFQAMYKE